MKEHEVSIQVDDPSLYESIVTHMDSGVCFDTVIYSEGRPVDYRIERVNDAFCRILGVTREQTEGRLASEVYGLQDAPFLEIYEQVASSGEPVSFDSYFAPADTYLHITASSPKKGHFSTVFHVITDQVLMQKRTELLLQKERDRREELDGLSSIAKRLLENEDLVDLSQQVLHEVLSQTSSPHGYVLLLEDEDRGYRMVATLLDQEVPQRGQLDHRFSEVGPFIDNAPQTYSKRPLLDVHTTFESLLLLPLAFQGTIYGYLCAADRSGGYTPREQQRGIELANLLAMGVRNMKRLEHIRHSEGLYTSFLNASTDYMFIKDSEGTYTIANDSLGSFFGLSVENIIGKSDHELMDKPAADECRSSDLLALTSGTPITVEQQIGNRRFTVTKFRIDREPEEPLIGGIIRDVTTDRENEENLALESRRMESQLRIIGQTYDNESGFFDQTLKEILDLTVSSMGYIYQYDEKEGRLSLSSWKSTDPDLTCERMHPEYYYELEDTGIWGEAIRQRRALVINDFSEHPLRRGYPDYHLPIRRYMSIPVILDGVVKATVGVANKDSAYTQTESRQLTLLMEAVWKEKEHRQTIEELKKLQWMLSPSLRGFVHDDPQSYGDLTELNTNGTIHESISSEVLKNICYDYLDLLGSSSAIYEANGDYALGIFSSGWCKLLDDASRRLCETASNEEALASGKWLCHESCWSDCSRRAIEQGEPVDIVCHGGIHLFAIPIRSRGRVIGAINMGYGDPPKDIENLKEISEKYRIDYERLYEAAISYQSRPAYIIEMAKRRLSESARVIGLLVEQKEARSERDLLNEQLRQSQKLEAIGQLAGGIAHDFNNILQGIMGYAQILEEGCQDSSKLTSEAIGEILANSKRASELTRQLLSFSRRQVLSRKTQDLGGIVEGLKNMIGRLIGEHITLQYIPGKFLASVNVDRSMIEQVLINLCVNSKDAMPKGGTLTIETQNTLIDESYCATHSGAVPGRYVLLSVTDTGMGMDKDTLEHIFEPFFTTKKAHEGTGLGLSTVYGIIKQHDGSVQVYSEKDKGTTFKIYFPQSQQSATNVGPLLQKAPQGGDDTILIAEDDEVVRTLLVHILKKAGYTVLTACDGQEAIRLYGENQERVDLCIFDVVMPNLGGHEAYLEIAKVNPALPVLYTSGYSPNAIHTNFILHEGVKLLQKPYSPNTLLRVVRELLDPCP